MNVLETGIGEGLEVQNSACRFSVAPDWVGSGTVPPFSHGHRNSEQMPIKASQTRYPAYIYLDARTRAHLSGWHWAPGQSGPFHRCWCCARHDVGYLTSIAWQLTSSWWGDLLRQLVHMYLNCVFSLWTTHVDLLFSKEGMRAQGLFARYVVSSSRQLGSSPAGFPFKGQGA